MERPSNTSLTRYIFASWGNWAFSMGMICILVLVSPWISREMLPVVAVGMAVALGIRIYSKRRERFRANAVPYIAAITLVLDSIVMWLFNLMAEFTDLYELAGKPVNEELPFVVLLLVSPSLAIVSMVFYYRRLRRRRYLKTSWGRSVSNHVLRIVWHESRYNVKTLIVLSMVISLVSWGYCIMSFSSDSFSRHDMFIFVQLPLILYVVSLVALVFRCLSVMAYYNQREAAGWVGKDSETVIRYIVLSGDLIYLAERTLSVKGGEARFFDTPLRLKHPFVESLSDARAVAIFKRFTGIEADVRLRFLYKDEDGGLQGNVFHFIVKLDDAAAVEDSSIRNGEWMTLAQLRHVDHEHRLSAELSQELVHIYTVGMMFKTYDRDGKRLYNIRHYRPTFKLADMFDWDVDFSDMRWFKVAKLNADKPFFTIRNWMRKLSDAALR